MNRVSIEPALLGWAKNRSGRSTEFFRQRFPKFDSWERGETLPTLKQLEDFARATYTPFGFFFLDKPPIEILPITDFRTMGDSAISYPSPGLLDTIYLCQNRLDWYREEARSLGEPPLDFIGSLDTSVDVSTAGVLLRHALAFDVEKRRQFPTWSEALRQFISQADALGILVMVSSIVGSNTHRQLNPNEFRGFALSDSWAPLVFINGADTKAAQMFTLAHEIAHLWIGESGISDTHMTARTDHTIERWCNNVAAELLVPSQMILHEFEPRAKLMVETKRLARRFKVSTLVTLRRMHDVGCIGWQEFRAAYQEEARRLHEIPKGGGGSAVNNVSARAGKRLARALIVSVLEGRTSYSEAFMLLGIKKLSTFEKIIESLGVGV